jgi:hypothetical protein
MKQTLTRLALTLPVVWLVVGGRRARGSWKLDPVA